MGKALRDITPEESAQFLVTILPNSKNPTSYVHIGVMNEPGRRIIRHADFGNDYTSALNSYCRAFFSFDHGLEQSALANNAVSPDVHVPTLLITGTKDIVCIDGRPEITVEGCVEKKRLKVKDINARHWVMLEQTAEFNGALEDWLEDTEEKTGKNKGC